MPSSRPPPPPPPPQPSRLTSNTNNNTNTNNRAPPPTVSPAPNTPHYILSLLIYNGHPFKDHWAFFLQPHPTTASSRGTKIHATGDVLHGFVFEVKRFHDVERSPDRPVRRVALGWIEASLCVRDNESSHGGWEGVEEDRDGDGDGVKEYTPACRFERIMYGVEVPRGSLNPVSRVQEGNENDNNGGRMGRWMMQHKDCQTWVVEVAEVLVREGVLVEGREGEVLAFLRGWVQ